MAYFPSRHLLLALFCPLRLDLWDGRRPVAQNWTSSTTELFFSLTTDPCSGCAAFVLLVALISCSATKGPQDELPWTRLPLRSRMETTPRIQRPFNSGDLFCISSLGPLSLGRTKPRIRGTGTARIIRLIVRQLPLSSMIVNQQGTNPCVRNRNGCRETCWPTTQGIGTLGS